MFLGPDNQNSPAAGPFTIGRELTGDATLVSPTAFNNSTNLGDNPRRGADLNLVGATPDPVGAAPDTTRNHVLTATHGVDPGANGFCRPGRFPAPRS